MSTATNQPLGKKAMHVLIPEGITSRNHGEAAIFHGICAGLGEIRPVSISLCTGDRAQDAGAYGSGPELISDNVVTASSAFGRWVQEVCLLLRHGVFAAVCRLGGRRAGAWFRAPLWQAYLRTDLIVFGHDNVLAGRTRFNHLLIPAVARALGTPIVVYAGTVGPFRDRFSRGLIGWLLRQTDLVTLREPRSVDNVKLLVKGDYPPVRLAMDPAFLMPSASEDRIREILRENGIPPDVPLVAMTTSAEMARRHAAAHGRDLRNGEELYVRERAALADRLASRGYWIMLLPHCVEGTGRRNDFLTNRQLAGYAQVPERVRPFPNRYTPQELKGLIGHCRMLVAERTHSMIAAASMAVPLVGISSHATGTKTRGILGEAMGLQDWLLDVETLRSETLAEVVDRCLERAEDIRSGLRARLPEVRRLARMPAQWALELADARKHARAEASAAGSPSTASGMGGA